ncbi:MAG: response regulator, partial [Gemmataceae bacterium]|nr:response regulator [Gemmataceae bacterium]
SLYEGRTSCAKLGIQGKLGFRIASYIALSLVAKQMQAGMIDAAGQTLQQALAALEKVDQSLRTPPPPVRALGALLVEDDANEQALLSSYLRMSGIRVDVVGDGSEALEFLSYRQRPDIVLMDMRLPRFDGPSTVAAIRENPAYQGLTIFAVTGSSPTEFNLPLGKRGVDAWFQKPLNPARIVEAITTLPHPN